MAATDAFVQLKKLLDLPGPAALGPDVRPNVMPPEALLDQIKGSLRSDPSSEHRRELICALLLLWHDHLDAAHELAQKIEDADGSYVHGLVHRREPDYGNAKYWFRRVGRHECFGKLAQRASALLVSTPGHKLTPGGEWAPYAFIDACEAAANSGSADASSLLRTIQQIEFETLLEYFCAR